MGICAAVYYLVPHFALLSGPELLSGSLNGQITQHDSLAHSV